MFQLTVRGPDGSEKLYFLGADQGLLVGRDETSDICLPSARVSRRHARFYANAQALFIEDLGSQGGVFVGGARITGATEIRPGPSIEIGEFSVRVKREIPISAADYVGTLTGAGTMQGRTLTLPAEKAIVGREAPAEIIIADDSVSRRQAEIRRMPDGTFVVRDLHSSNGTLLNNAKIPPDSDRPLRPNDKIAFGDTNWVVTSTNVGPSDNVQRSRARVLIGLALTSVVVLVAIGYAYVKVGVTDSGPATRHQDVSVRDACLGDIENERFDKAVASCQAAYEQDPIDLELRKKLRQAQREARSKSIYDQGSQKENSDELQALDLFFQIDPNSAYFPKAKIEIDRILVRQRPLLVATCRDGAKKKGNMTAIDPCIRSLNYACWVTNTDDLMKLLKNLDAKKAADWKCPPELRPWFGGGSTGPTAESECPKKYPNKDQAAACVSYANNEFGVANNTLSKVKEEKAVAAQMRDDIQAVQAKFNQGQTAARQGNLATAKTIFDSALQVDGRLAPSNVESQIAASMKNMLSDAFVQQGEDANEHHNAESAYRACGTAAIYKKNYQHVSKCLENAANVIVPMLASKQCSELRELFDMAPEGPLSGPIQAAAQSKSCPH